MSDYNYSNNYSNLQNINGNHAYENHASSSTHSGAQPPPYQPLNSHIATGMSGPSGNPATNLPRNTRISLSSKFGKTIKRFLGIKNPSNPNNFTQMQGNQYSPTSHHIAPTNTVGQGFYDDDYSFNNDFKNLMNRDSKSAVAQFTNQLTIYNNDGNINNRNLAQKRFNHIKNNAINIVNNPNAQINSTEYSTACDILNIDCQIFYDALMNSNPKMAIDTHHKLLENIHNGSDSSKASVLMLDTLHKKTEHILSNQNHEQNEKEYFAASEIYKNSYAFLINKKSSNIENDFTNALYEYHYSDNQNGKYTASLRIDVIRGWAGHMLEHPGVSYRAQKILGIQENFLQSQA